MKNKYIQRKDKYPKFIRIVHCSCGSEAKERVRKNYPFGRKSKCRKITEFCCISCGKKQ